MTWGTHPWPHAGVGLGAAARGVEALRLAGVLVIAVGASFLLVTMLAASIAPAYDYHAAAISDLGTVDATAVLFNLLLVSIGVLNALAGLLLYRAHGRRVVLALYLLSGIGAVGAGVYPLDHPSGLHAVFAALAFLSFNLQALATAIQLGGATRVLGLAAGAAGLAFLVVMVIGDGGSPDVFGAIGHGGTERMIAYPVMLWLLAFGGSLLGARDDRVMRG